MLRALARHAAVLVAAVPVAVLPASTCGAAELVELYAPSPCIACIDWATHLRQRGLSVQVKELTQAELDGVKERLRIPAGLRSRHTAAVAGYFIEGHVPVDDILELLRDRPRARGLAVPGLPRGAPGLELTSPTCETACTLLDNDSGVRDIKRELYDTLLVLPDGGTRIWARH